jgi:hypothetical protein
MASLTIDLTPTLEQRLHELAAEQGLAVDDLVRCALESLVEPRAESSPVEPSELPIWEKLIEIANQVPEEEIADQPTDLAEQHDHYIYGTPKKR